MISKKHIQFIICLTFLLGTISCEHSSPEKKKEEPSIVKKEPIKPLIKEKIEPLKKKDSIFCACPKTKAKKEYALKFDSDFFSIDSLNKIHTKEAIKVNTIELYHFDSVPASLSKFTNVERIILGPINWDTVLIPDVFPNLKAIKLYGKTLDLRQNPSYLKKIEEIEAEKSKIIGLKSFTQTPNLKKFKYSFSGFDTFPEDFNSLKCLNYFQTGAHFNDTIDLSVIDLRNMPCLDFVQFHTWNKNMKGLPIGLEEINNFKILHGNLTKEEKETLGSIKNDSKK